MPVNVLFWLRMVMYMVYISFIRCIPELKACILIRTTV